MPVERTKCALICLEAQKQGISHIILDVRDSGRGSNSEAIAIARLFIPSGTLTTLKGQTVPEQVFAADPAKVVWKGPVSVLTSDHHDRAR